MDTCSHKNLRKCEAYFCIDCNKHFFIQQESVIERPLKDDSFRQKLIDYFNDAPDGEYDYEMIIKETGIPYHLIRNLMQKLTLDDLSYLNKSSKVNHTGSRIYYIKNSQQVMQSPSQEAAKESEQSAMDSTTSKPENPVGFSPESKRLDTDLVAEKPADNPTQKGRIKNIIFDYLKELPKGTKTKSNDVCKSLDLNYCTFANYLCLFEKAGFIRVPGDGKTKYYYFKGTKEEYEKTKPKIEFDEQSGEYGEVIDLEEEDEEEKDLGPTEYFDKHPEDPASKKHESIIFKTFKNEFNKIERLGILDLNKWFYENGVMIDTKDKDYMNIKNYINDLCADKNAKMISTTKLQRLE